MNDCSAVRSTIGTDIAGNQVELKGRLYSKIDSNRKLHRYCMTVVINNDKEHNFRGEHVAKCQICNKVIK